jgi:hypothetical protein
MTPVCYYEVAPPQGNPEQFLQMILKKMTGNIDYCIGHSPFRASYGFPGLTPWMILWIPYLPNTSATGWHGFPKPLKRPANKYLIPLLLGDILHRPRTTRGAE